MVPPMPPDADTELPAGTYLVNALPMPFEVTVPDGVDLPRPACGAGSTNRSPHS